jgi:beta-phosphoglucomutase
MTKITILKNKAVIFDFDGVVIDTVPYHYKSWKKLFKEQGISFTFKDYLRINGITREKGITMVMGKISKDKIQRLSARKQIIYRNLLDKKIPPLLPGFKNLLAILLKNKYPVAIASSSKNCKYILEKLKLINKLDAVVGGNDFKKPKPDPDIYLTTAKKLKVRPNNCMVIEDAYGGIKSAKNAKMYCVGLTTHASKKELKGADIYIYSLKNLNLNKIINILG